MNTPEKVSGSPAPRLLHEIFERQVALRPDCPAVELEETAQRLTYRQINDRAESVARRLGQLGLRPNDVVGIHLPRGIDQYVCMLGILKAGGAYLPIDPDFPAQRVRFMLRDSAAPFVIATSELATGEIADPAQPLILDQFPWPGVHPLARLSDPQPATPADLCYVIYTSGSTGQPKGVAISHLNAVAFVNAVIQTYGVLPSDRVLQGFSTTFDASVEEIWMAFATGGTMVVATVDTMHSLDELPARLAELEINVFSTTPTVLSAMPAAGLPDLRLLIMGGEAARADIIDKWARPGRRLMNSYGPTETTVVATFAWCRPGDPVTIGSPLPGYQTIILDEQGREVPPGQEGELCIGGPGVSLRGYLNHPDLNRTRFFEHRGARFYHSGDLARRDASGQLLYGGRIDSQVKIRGYRVELEEIEARILEAVSCENAIVALQQDPARGPELVAYLVSRSPAALDLYALRGALRDKMPAYMVPAHFLHLYPSEVPRHISGKVNRPALPPPNSARHTLPPPLAAPVPAEVPASLAEAKLRDIFHKVLGEPLGLSESFFDYGGNSMLAARAISCCRECQSLEHLSIRDIYQNPSVRSLAARLEVRRSEAAESPRAAPAPSAAPTTPAHRVSAKQYALCVTAQVSVILALVAASAYLLLASAWVTFWIDKWLVSYDSLPLTALVAIGFLLLLPVLAAAGLAAGLLLKRVFIGRFREGDWPLWSWGYFRWWCASLLETPLRALVAQTLASPLAPFLYRLHGARIGRNVYLASALTEPELVTIDAGASIADGVILRTHALEDGLLKLRRIHVGRNCFVGSRAMLGGGARMGENCKLHPLSALPADTFTPAGTEWLGSPAGMVQTPGNNLSRILRRHEADSSPSDFWATPRARLKILLLKYAYTSMFGLIALGPTALSLALLLWLESVSHAVTSLNLSILLPWSIVSVAVSFAGRLAAIIAGKWALGGRAKPGTCTLSSQEFVRRRFVRQLMGYLVSPDGARGVTETLLMPVICRALGMKVGPGAEVSDATGFQPDLVTLGQYSMLADGCVLGEPVIHRGRMTLGPIVFGDRVFVGNGAQVSISTPAVPDDCLIGVLSTPPDHSEHATDWLGCPPMQLSARKHWAAPTARTFQPPWYQYPIRGFHNFWKMVLPGAAAEMVFWATLKAAIVTFEALSLSSFLLLFPLLILAAGLLRMLLPVAAKWLLIGRYRAGTRFMWSHWIWRAEIAYEFDLASPAGNYLNGTPLLNWWYRLMGARIGRRVCILGGALGEADLVTLGNDVTVEGFLQTHLFEDRVMNLGPVTIGKGCSVGAESCVLYNSRMGDYSKLGDLSLIMKNESFMAHAAYQGLPAERLTTPQPPATAIEEPDTTPLHLPALAPV